MLTLWNSKRNNPLGLSFLEDSFHRFDDFFKLFDERPIAITGRQPYVEIETLDDKVEIAVTLPGLNKDDVDVKLDGKMLVIDATSKKEEERRSFTTSFLRTWTLGPEHDIEGIDAEMKDGVLRVTVPLKEKPKQKATKITIR